ncbi:MAG: helix-turn-helix domain-containing protein [Actinobacteria bacterium]|nr:helix-turn-helix domain-containing protein [Actinomycetota bacterium]
MSELDEPADQSAYRERRSAVAGITLWTRVTDGSPAWILPDGCIDVLWDGAVLTVAGPDTSAHAAHAPAGTRYAAVRFDSGVAPTVLGVPADAIRDERPVLAEVIAADHAHRLAASLRDAGDPAAELERWAGQRLAEGGGGDRTMRQVARLLGAGRAVADVADAVGFSGRQLNRRSLASFGYGPKVLARVLRLQRALGSVRDGMTFVDAALAAGYGDQAHFAHEVRALTGRTATQLVGSEANRSTPLPSGSRSVA